jgi:hypothetical protein
VAVSGVQCRASGPCGGAPSARRGPVSPNILQGHRGAQPGRHDAYQGYRPAMDRCLAWRPQPMVRLPAPWHRAVSCRPAFVERCGGDHVYGVVTPDDLTGTHQDRSAWDGVFGPVYEKTVYLPRTHPIYTTAHSANPWRRGNSYTPASLSARQTGLLDGWAVSDSYPSRRPNTASIPVQCPDGRVIRSASAEGRAQSAVRKTKYFGQSV